jgi:hypothetical protein
MSKTILAEVEGFIPVIDTMIPEVGLMTATVFGKVWRYCQMEDGVCMASQERLANEMGVSRVTLNQHINKLIETEYLEDMTPALVGLPHTYRDTGKAGLAITMVAQPVKKLYTSYKETLQPPIKKLYTKIVTKKEKDTNIDDYKQRIASATAQGILNSGKSHSKGIRQWPPDVQVYGDVWTRCIELGTMQLTRSQYALCIKEFRELQAREITPELFETGYHGAAYFDGMSVTHPLGCWYAADEVRRGIRSPEGNRKDTKTKPRPNPVSAEA